VALPEGRALLVLGEAGHGKTTVALHRLAHLWRERGAERARMRTAVVVPAEGLARLMQPVLRRLGVDVEARTYDAWAAAQARRAFRDLPRRESELAPHLVARFKRDPALRGALTAVARRPAGRVDDDRDGPRVRSRALARRADLQHLFGDRRLVEAVVRASEDLPARAVGEVLEHTRLQFALTAEEEWAHVTDKARLKAVDRRQLDEGTSSADASTVDVEDYAVLFEIDRIRASALSKREVPPKRYDTLLVDEAQEFAPLELNLLGRSLAPGGTLVVAGDADQQTGATTRFRGWEVVMGELGCAEHTTARLDISYRCPPEVVALARGILREGKRLPTSPPIATFANETELARELGHALQALRRSDPRASIVVLCHTPRTARRLADRLRLTVPTRVVFDGRFLARGPVQVTTVEEAKGLEFDFVVVPDATATDYPDTPAARRALYVAVTRARHQVVLSNPGERTPLV